MVIELDDDPNEDERLCLPTLPWRDAMPMGAASTNTNTSVECRRRTAARSVRPPAVGHGAPLAARCPQANPRVTAGH